MEDYPDQNKTDDAEQEPSRKLPKIPNLAGRRRLPDLPPPIMEASKEAMSQPGAEAVTFLDKPTEAATEGAARFGKELIRQRQEARLEEEVTQLSQEAQDAQTEQQTIAKQQEAFSHELDNSVATRRELSRQNLRSRLPQAEPPAPKRLELASAQIEKLKALNEQPETAPEVVLHTVEEAAEQDIPMEAAYERRHERKEERPTPRVEDEEDKEPEEKSIPAAQAQEEVQQPEDQSDITSEEPQEIVAPKQVSTPAKPPKSLYKQAIRAGFWTAIALVVVLIVFILLSRR